MYLKLSMWLRWVLLASLLVGKAAFAQFISLHQFPVAYTTSSGLDGQGNYFSQTQSFSGFKNQFSPYGVPGCVIGYEEFRSSCQSVNGGLSFSLSGYTSYKEFKVYIPAGTTFFSLTGNLPQNTRYGVTARLGQAPARTSPIDDNEYETIRSTQNPNTAFARMQSGEEVLLVHNYGGNVALSGDARLSSAPLTQGVWLYIRVLAGDSIYLLGAVNEVNRTAYKQVYDQMVSAQLFGADGDPTDVPCTSCNSNNGSGGNTGGVTVDPTLLTGFDLSSSVVNVGVSASTLTISPQPSTASLPVCTLSPSNMGTVLYNQVVLSSSGINALTEPLLVTVSCASVSKQITVNPAGSVAAASAEVTTALDGKVILKVTIRRKPSEVVSGAKTNVWIGGLIPVNAFFFQTDTWFFLASNGWTQSSSLDINSVARSKDVPLTSVTEVIEVPLGFTKAELSPLKVQIHVGYNVNGGAFQNLGSVWSSVL